MDIYVESNFVLELALEQEQHESCRQIVELSHAGKARLIIPAYSLIEPYERIVRYAKKRTRVANDLADEVKKLLRSKSYQEETDALQNVTGLLVRSLQEEKNRFRRTVDKLLAVSEIIPLEARVLLDADRYQIDHDLSVQDSVVYASVLTHLRASTSTDKCFLNRNRKDFDDPDIEETLNTHGCKMLFSFDKGYGYISSRIRL